MRHNIFTSVGLMVLGALLAGLIGEWDNADPERLRQLDLAVLND